MSPEEYLTAALTVGTALGLRETLAYVLRRRRSSAEDSKIEAEAGKLREEALSMATKSLLSGQQKLFDQFRNEIDRHLHEIDRKENVISELREHRDQCEKDLADLKKRVAKLEDDA